MLLTCHKGALVVCLLIAGLVAVASSAEARDTEYKLKIADVLQNPEFKSKLGSDVAFYFGAGKGPSHGETRGELVANRKTNSVGRSDEEVCQWAMLSALLSLRDRALKEGGNAVVDIVSYYKKATFSSTTEYECHAGAIVAGVALKGAVVKLAK